MTRPRDRPSLPARRTQPLLAARAAGRRVRRHPGGQGHRPRRRQRRAGVPDRRQRRRQDDDAEGHLRPAAGQSRQRSATTATTSPGAASFELVRRGLAMVPEGRGMFGALTIEENLAMGAYMRARPRGDRGRRRARVHAVSAAEGAPPADRRHAVRRRAADARDGPRNDVAAEAAAARRAVDGTGAADGAEGVRDDPRGFAAKA